MVQFDLGGEWALSFGTTESRGKVPGSVYSFLLGEGKIPPTRLWGKTSFPLSRSWTRGLSRLRACSHCRTL